MLYGSEESRFTGMVYLDRHPLPVDDGVRRVSQGDIPAVLREHTRSVLNGFPPGGPWMTVGAMYTEKGSDFTTVYARWAPVPTGDVYRMHYGLEPTDGEATPVKYLLRTGGVLVESSLDEIANLTAMGDPPEIRVMPG